MTLIFQAFVSDIFENEVAVAFENDWLPPARFPFSRVRLPPKDLPSKDIQYTEAQEVEVYSRANEQEAFGWWSVVIKVGFKLKFDSLFYALLIKGEFFVVDYVPGDGNSKEILPIDRLRPKNTNPPITKSTFVKFELSVPEDVRDFLRAPSVMQVLCSSPVLQLIKGEFFVVDYVPGDGNSKEILPIDRLRPKNTNPPITKSTFVKFELSVPEDVRDL
ncbi:unnamed protein product [Darwinula stevensoni]|uniref:Agenet-like domain-containing protein n=1 Tax=Darwinula stevensoni TaxID=69355 RepID=A0A7R9A4C9_9CRUS|nr:unnamed protein product [Darwinula stevensoni]CAG0889738.1 unnamed protein product [Darwinula stevensoni]